MVTLYSCFLSGALLGSFGGVVAGSAAIGPLLVAQGLLWLGLEIGFRPTAKESENLTNNTGKMMHATLFAVPLLGAVFGSVLGGAAGALVWSTVKTALWVVAHLSITWK